MFGYNYRYTINPDKNVIKLAPTAGTYIKAFVPMFVLWGGLGAMMTIASVLEKRNEKKNDTDPDND